VAVQVTGFSNEEEEAVGKHEIVPFLLEDKLKENGGVFSKGDSWSIYALADDRVVTGQNPQSSKEVASLLVKALQG
jgi:putative intracellular protease/amidase